MLEPQKTLDTYYLEARRDLLEVLPLLDRYDRSVEKQGQKAEDESRLNSLLEAMCFTFWRRSSRSESNGAIAQPFCQGFLTNFCHANYSTTLSCHSSNRSGLRANGNVRSRCSV